jgi:predicted AAA+ superfamily ATPase
LGILEPYTKEERGRVFELVVGAQLIRAEMPVYYWREKDYEVDYVVKLGRSLYAIEVKSGRKKRHEGLMKMQEKYPHAKSIIITPENYREFESDPLKFLATYSV